MPIIWSLHLPKHPFRPHETLGDGPMTFCLCAGRNLSGKFPYQQLFARPPLTAWWATFANAERHFITTLVNPISLITIPKLSSTSTELVFHLQWISGFHFLKQMVTNAFIPGGPSKGFTFALHQPWSGFLSLYIFLCTLLSQCSKLLPFNMLKVLEMFPFVSKLTTWNS